MQHQDEVWQELGFNGEKIGGVLPSEFDDAEVKLFSGAVVMLYRFKDGEVEFLFQHRAKILNMDADKWDISAGGHTNLDEEMLDAAVREAEEEIGVKIDANNLEIAAMYRRWEGKREAFVALYFYDWGSGNDDFCFDDGEVEEVKWVRYSELGDFWPNLKSVLVEDVIFRHYLDEWNAKVLKRNENL